MSAAVVILAPDGHASGGWGRHANGIARANGKTPAFAGVTAKLMTGGVQ